MRRNLFKVIATATIVSSVFIIESTAAARLVKASKDESFTIEKDVIYLPDHTRKEKADLYIPNPTGDAHKDHNRPAMVVIHGGGFQIHDKGDVREKKTSKLLASNGIVAMSINYLLWTKKTGDVFPTNI